MTEFRLRHGASAVALCAVLATLAACDSGSSTTSSAPGASAPTSAASAASAAASAALVARNGVFELADVIRAVMVDSGPGEDTKPAGLRDYNDFKSVLTGIKRVEPGEVNPGEIPPSSAIQDLHLYRGAIVLGIGGTKLSVENIEDIYAWGGYVSGPNAAASLFALASGRAVNPKVPPPDASYFNKAGFKLTPLVCQSPGGAGNYSALYLAQLPGKRPAFFRIDASTGSAGAFYSFALYLGSVPWSDVPGLAKSVDVPPAFGDCPING